MNIYLPILPLKTVLDQQIDKVQEEVAELLEAVETKRSDIDIAQEAVDVIQSAAGVLQLLEQRGVSMDGVVVNHRIKLLNRGWQPQGVHNVRIK